MDSFEFDFEFELEAINPTFVMQKFRARYYFEKYNEQDVLLQS